MKVRIVLVSREIIKILYHYTKFSLLFLLSDRLSEVLNISKQAIFQLNILHLRANELLPLVLDEAWLTSVSFTVIFSIFSYRKARTHERQKMSSRIIEYQNSNLYKNNIQKEI